MPGTLLREAEHLKAKAGAMKHVGQAASPASNHPMPVTTPCNPVVWTTMSQDTVKCPLGVN